MKTLGLLDFFKQAGYNYETDLQTIEKICYYTKTRVGGNGSALDRGCEQPFLLKALVEWFKVQNFFEIGTGRGTGCYSVCLSPTVKKILTVDVLDFDQKFSTAIGHKSVNVSLRDLFDLIPHPEKNKIQFVNRKKLEKIPHFDLFFIDGEHNDHRVIEKDFKICYDANPNGIFVFDDYENKKFAVKRVVDEILENHSEFDSLLVEFRGHLFGGEKEKNEGLVILKKGTI